MRNISTACSGVFMLHKGTPACGMTCFHTWCQVYRHNRVCIICEVDNDEEGTIVFNSLCPAEGKKSNIVVMGEKGRAQLVRVERDRILGTMNDINKMRITFAQVTCPLNLALCSLHWHPVSSRLCCSHATTGHYCCLASCAQSLVSVRKMWC